MKLGCFWAISGSTKRNLHNSPQKDSVVQHSKSTKMQRISKKAKGRLMFSLMLSWGIECFFIGFIQVLCTREQHNTDICIQRVTKPSTPINKCTGLLFSCRCWIHLGTTGCYYVWYRCCSDLECYKYLVWQSIKIVEELRHHDNLRLTISEWDSRWLADHLNSNIIVNL